MKEEKRKGEMGKVDKELPRRQSEQRLLISGGSGGRSRRLQKDGVVSEEKWVKNLNTADQRLMKVEGRRVISLFVAMSDHTSVEMKSVKWR